jgi:thiopurine S-methyltransferase
MMNLNRDFWENRYKTSQIGWDIGTVSTPLKTYINQLENKNLNILIPGAGNAYEAEFLFENGFQSVTVIDIASKPLQNLKRRVVEFPENQLIQTDFFDFEGRFDLIIEQTFFCALHPSLREKYVLKMSQLLKPKGKLAGLLFDFKLTEDGPPFGGSFDEYQALFEPFFVIKKLERCHNSIQPRQGNELFFIFEKK